MKGLLGSKDVDSSLARVARFNPLAGQWELIPQGQFCWMALMSFLFQPCQPALPGRPAKLEERI